MEKIILPLVIGIVILVLLFLVLREINCWYWKINERITLQNETNQLLKRILSQQNTTSTQREQISSEDQKLFCPSCGKEYSNSASAICENCGKKL